MSEPQVLFVTDLEGDLEHGMLVAGKLAAERSATLIVLHVVEMTTREGEAMMYHALRADRYPPERRMASLEVYDLAVRVVPVVEVGDPETEIAAFVEQNDVVLMVMEVRPRSFLKRAFSRSLTERLIGRVKCPVMTYRRAAVPVASPSLPLIESEEQLTTLLNARVDALVGWLRAQRERVATVAQTRSVRDAVASLAHATSHALDRPLLRRVHRNLELELAEHCRALPAMGVEIVHGTTTVVRHGLMPRSDAARARFLDTMEHSEMGVSLPLDADGQPGLVIDAAATIPLPGNDRARLSFVLDARRDFLRILDEPGPDPTAETYAFDRDGMMLSNSRFSHQLRHVGLLPVDPRVQTPRRLKICDPGGNLLDGFTRPKECPLTRMARDATAGHDGSDWRGYRDYRGVEVVGTWRWVDDLGFGVAAEIDRLALH